MLGSLASGQQEVMGKRGKGGKTVEERKGKEVRLEEDSRRKEEVSVQKVQTQITRDGS